MREDPGSQQVPNHLQASKGRSADPFSYRKQVSAVGIRQDITEQEDPLADLPGRNRWVETGFAQLGLA